MASTRALLFIVVAVAAVLGTVHGASYTVGAPAGSWDLRTNYTVWASSITFRAGDQLVFRYNTSAHNVVEVSRAGYDACNASVPIATFHSGADVVPLPQVGAIRYFICGVQGHCATGMKLMVTVRAAAPAPAPSPCRVRRQRRRYSTGRRSTTTSSSRLCTSDGGAASGPSGRSVTSSVLVMMVFLTFGLMF